MKTIKQEVDELKDKKDFNAYDNINKELSSMSYNMSKIHSMIAGKIFNEQMSILFSLKYSIVNELKLSYIDKSLNSYKRRLEGMK